MKATQLSRILSQTSCFNSKDLKTRGYCHETIRYKAHTKRRLVYRDGHSTKDLVSLCLITVPPKVDSV